VSTVDLCHSEPPALNARTRIITAARDAFVTGCGEFEMTDVANGASVSNGLAYHYFGSKSGLVSALIADFYDRYDAVVNQRLPEGLSWHEREYLRLLATLEFLFSDRMAPIVLGRLSGNAQVVAMEASRRDAIIELAERNIRRGQERGEIDPGIDPGIAAAAINGGLRQAVATALHRGSVHDPEEFARQAWGFVAGALSLPRRPWAEPSLNSRAT
jgi:AcrR family transcriptional regulator